VKAELLFNLQERWRDFAKNHFVAQTAPISFIISIKVSLNFVLSIPQDISFPQKSQGDYSEGRAFVQFEGKDGEILPRTISSHHQHQFHLFFHS
jgi:hypothetical protein